MQEEAYDGAKTMAVIRELGMDRSVVAELMLELPTKNNYNLYFGNLFMSLSLSIT